MLKRLPLILLTVALAAGGHAETTAEKWVSDLAKSATLLQAGDHERSLKISERLLREMIDQLGRGDAAMRIFGGALTHKALALAGLGREEDALWHWHSVLTLDPAFEKSDLSSFGDAGAFLAANRDPRKPWNLAEEGGQPLTAEFTAPKTLKQVMPKFPRGAQFFGVEGVLVVSVMITREGTVRAPVVRKALPAPTLSYVALEAIRQWRFQPATKNGTPIEVQFDLSVNFKP